MNLFSRSAFTFFCQGLVRRLHSLKAIFPLFIGLSIEHDEARFAVHRQDQGPLGLLEQAREPGRLAFECGQRMDVFGDVNDLLAPQKHLIRCE